MHRYERDRGWRNDDRRARGDREDEGMLERIKNDVKAWFGDDDDEYEGAGYGTSSRYSGSRGSRRADWDDDYDRFRHAGQRSRYGRHIGEGDYSDTGGYGDSTFGGYRRYDRDNERRYGRESGGDDRYGGRFGNRYTGRRGQQFGGGYGGDYRRDEGRWSGRGSDRQYGSDLDEDYDDETRFGGDDDDYRNRLTQGGTGRRTPVVLYSEYWVTPGPHAGIGPKGYEKSPEALRERVCERLQGHGELDASDIEVSCENEEVTLTGTVRNRRQKRLAEDCAEAVFGVRDVHNRLTVSREYEGQYLGQDYEGRQYTDKSERSTSSPGKGSETTRDGSTSASH